MPSVSGLFEILQDESAEAQRSFETPRGRDAGFAQLAHYVLRLLLREFHRYFSGVK